MSFSLKGPDSRVELSPGVAMPVLGLGVFQIEENDLYHVVSSALEAGCRLFDTAKYYRTRGRWAVP